jgi:hypothetical protein
LTPPLKWNSNPARLRSADLSDVMDRRKPSARWRWRPQRAHYW